MTQDIRDPWGSLDSVEFGNILSDLYTWINKETELSTDHHLVVFQIRGKVDTHDLIW